MKPYFFGKRAIKHIGGQAIGATGKYPHGKQSHDDEGELKVAIGADHENQRVRF